jgi:transcriptional regulator of acetoin/glycerol metabolism
VLRRAVVLAAGASILPSHVRLDRLMRAPAIADLARMPKMAGDSAMEQSSMPCTDARGAAASAEKTAIVEALKQHAGDVNLCSKVLGISRATLYRRIRRYDLR